MLLKSDFKVKQNLIKQYSGSNFNFHSSPFYNSENYAVLFDEITLYSYVKVFNVAQGTNLGKNPRFGCNSKRKYKEKLG